MTVKKMAWGNPAEGDKEKIKDKILVNERNSKYNKEFQNTI